MSLGYRNEGDAACDSQEQVIITSRALAIGSSEPVLRFIVMSGHELPL